MKVGGRSWNYSLKKKQGVLSRFKCRECGREYKMEWARANHEKLCIQRFKNAGEDND